MHELSQPCKQVLLKAEFAYLYMFLHNTGLDVGRKLQLKTKAGCGKGRPSTDPARILTFSSVDAMLPYERSTKSGR